jgi:hypothetical protein
MKLFIMFIFLIYTTNQLNKTQNLCFPLKRDSFNYVSNNWGDARSSGARYYLTFKPRCHAGLDVYTKRPGTVISVEDGVVTAIFNFCNFNN